jgi:hypothetical protein
LERRVWKQKKKSRDKTGTSGCLHGQLGGSALAVEILVIFFVLVHAFFLSRLSALLAGLSGLARLVLLTLLTRLAALLAGLPALLSTLLAIFLHIVCH